MNNEHGTTQVTENQRIIFHLGLQVYCGPSLKEHLHNPVMTHPACNIEWKVFILHTYGDVCMFVWCCVYEYKCMFVHYMCIMVYGCVYTCISVCHCVTAFKMVDKILQVYVRIAISNQTNKIEQFRELIIIPIHVYN